MLTTFFERLCEMSLIGSYTILVVLLARVFLKRCGRKYAYVLWGIVLINLCVPLSLRAPISLIPKQIVANEGLVQREEALRVDSVISERGEEGNSGVVTDAEALETQGNIESNAVGSFGISNTSNVTNTMETTSAFDNTSTSDENVSEMLYAGQSPEKVQTNVGASVSPAYKFSFAAILPVLWGLGVLTCAIWLSIQVIRMLKQLRVVQRKITKVEGRIRESSACPVPYVWGIFKPTIYLPTGLSECEKDYVLAHEECHIRRKDYLWKLVGLICCALHWFNPLVWLAYRCFCLDMEISCDEAVLRRCDEKTRAQYAESLLQFAARQNGYFGLVLTFGEPSVKERIKGILKYKRKPLIVSGIAVVCLLVLGIGLLVKPQSTESANSLEAAQSGEASQELQGTPSPSNEQRGNGPIDAVDVPSSEERGDGPTKLPQEEQEEIQKSIEEQEEIRKSIFAYQEYIGYLDECYEWTDCDAFTNQDYDMDGKYDRVYREFTGGSDALNNGLRTGKYRIEFGNGEVIEFADINPIGSPEVLAFDMTGDGQNEILFRQTYYWSTGPEGQGEFLLFEKVEGSYTKAKLPFNEEQETGVHTLLCDGKRNGEFAQFMIPSLGFGKFVRITDEEIWDEWYEGMMERLSEYAQNVWYAEPCVLPEGIGLKSYIHLFDKWSNYGYEFIVEYIDGSYKLTNVEFRNDESKSVVENINIITGTKIFPNLWEEGVHIVTFERWDAEGNRTGYGKLEGVEPYSIPMDCSYTIAVNEDDIVIDYWAE